MVEKTAKTPKKLWFRAKRFGWGWQPVTWQGWLAIVLWLLLVLAFFFASDSCSHSGSDTLIRFAGPFILLTAILLSVCYSKGEYPHWNWGNKK